MNKPTQNDLRAHALSLEIAALYRTLHESNGPIGTNDEACEDLLMAFRCVRRGIGIDPNTNKRCGSHSAYLAMQGKVSD